MNLKNKYYGRVSTQNLSIFLYLKVELSCWSTLKEPQLNHAKTILRKQIVI